MRKALILFGFIQITFSTACLSQNLNDTTAFEKRLALHALRTLYANAEVADTLYSAYKTCMNLKSHCDTIIVNCDSLDAEHTKINGELMWQRDNLLKEVNRKEKLIKWLLLGIAAAFVIGKAL